VTELVRDHWDDVKNGSLTVTRDYSATGFVGFVEDVVKGIADVTATVGGFAAGVVISVGYEMGHAFGGLDLGQTFGIIGGVVVFASGGTLLLAVAEGAAAGAVTNAMIKQRPLTPQEINFAKSKVFGDTIPWDRILLTNLSGLRGTAFTMPFIGGKIYVNLASNDAYNDPTNFKTGPDRAYPNPGQLFIHELTHAWQTEHAPFLPTFMCKAVVAQTHNTLGDDPYVYGPPGPVWSGFGPEQQAAIVDQWFGGTRVPAAPTRAAQDPHDPYFPYIRDNIRTGHA
jgi:hypothetical protein